MILVFLGGTAFGVGTIYGREKLLDDRLFSEKQPLTFKGMQNYWKLSLELTVTSELPSAKKSVNYLCVRFPYMDYTVYAIVGATGLFAIIVYIICAVSSGWNAKRNQKQLRRGKQPEEIKQSELLPKVCHRPTIQNRNCQSETFNSLDLETTSYSSKHTLTQGCQTLQFAYETINSENTSSSLNSEVYHLDDSLDFSSRSLPNFIRSHSTSQLCLPKWKSAMDWLEFREFPERIPSSEMSTHLISTDSLDNLLSSSVMQADKNLRRFDYTSRNELFVPEFIPLPNIKSPVQIIRKEFEKLSGEERNLAKSASLADLLNGVSYLHGRKWSSYYHINPTTEEQLKQRDEFFVANSDGEQDVLTIVTSLGSSASTFVEKEDEIIIPM
ncbi:unnamed protein product [Hymenolepis diminuta]|uniref:Conserved plasma membrane protein n=1 Tax=Hymenolepis diminuta TaxID=6216 RepID=A0A158QEZ5_HYMDI|nr:unnamed protein product [Hymenolepis diminuta]